MSNEHIKTDSQFYVANKSKETNNMEENGQSRYKYNQVDDKDVIITMNKAKFTKDSESPKKLTRNYSLEIPKVNLENIVLKDFNKKISLIPSTKNSNKNNHQVLKRLSLDYSPSQFVIPPHNSYSNQIEIPQTNDFHIEKYKENKGEYCDICFQDIKDKFTLACGDFFCKECLRQHVMNCLDDVTHYRNLRCPKTICDEKIKDAVLEKIISEKEYERYLKIKLRIEELYNPLNMACPIPDCDSFGLKTNIKNGNLICLNKHKFCVKCLKESHTGKACVVDPDETEKVLANDKLIKKCPNCKSWVEKQPGLCNNVTCANIWCSYAFCWICMSAYDKNHYSNPLSTCFGMQEVKNDSHFAKHKCLRITKCLLIFLLMIAILPIVILFFSFLVITFFILAFVLDGSAVKNLKLKTERRHKVFRFLIYATYIVISIPSLPFGYWTQCILIVSSPFIFIYKKCKKAMIEEEAE